MIRITLPPPPGSVDLISMGQLGADFINNTAAQTGDWAIIECWTDCTFTTLTTSTISLNGAAPGALNTITMTKGQLLRGRFSAITLATGSIMAYRASIPQT